MRIKRARQILKAFSDDTRLRIISLLNKGELSVTEICRTLNKNQSIISKHLTMLRLIGIARDRRKGMNVYYCLVRGKDKIHDKLVGVVTDGLSVLEVFKEDFKRLKEINKKNGNKKEK